MTNPNEDKLTLENAWANHTFINHRDAEAWHMSQSTHRIHVEQGSQMIYWESVDGQPRILDTVEVARLDASFISGLTLTLDTRQHGPLIINAYPNQALPGVFMWLPAFVDVRFTPRTYTRPGDGRRVTLPLILKTKNRSDRAPVDGVRYLSSVFEFCRLWPNIL